MNAAQSGTDGLPLDGLRVVDTTDGRGSLTTRVLADLGADVILVEPPGGGALRGEGVVGPGGVGLGALWRHAGKRSRTADLATPEGRATLEALLADADVWVDGHAPAVREALGLDLDALAAANDGLVVVSVTDFGRSGPYRDLPATDETVEALAGMIFKAGIAAKAPLLPPTRLATDVTDIVAAAAALLAVEQRTRTGAGQVVDVAVMTAAAATTDWSYCNASISRFKGTPYAETRQGAGLVYPMFKCADGYVRLIMMTQRQWRAFLEWMGNPEEWMDPHWDQFVNRLFALDVLCTVYEAFFADKKMLELCAEAQRRGIVATPVLDPAEILANDHFADRGTFVQTEIAPGADATIASGFFTVDGGRRAGFRGRAPEPGEHDGATFADRGRVAPAGGSAPDARPLAGVRVLDFGIGGVGVEASRLLAEYGADVIKVETRTYPDFIRTVLGSEMTPSFASSSRSKRSLGVNVKTEQGKELLHRLVAMSDIIVENSATGTMADMGLDYATCRAINPGIIMASSQLMGSFGRNADWIGYGPSTQPYGGLVHLWDYDDDDPPASNTTIFPDHLAGRLVALGALAALVGRRRTGEGRHVEVAQVEAVVNMLTEPFLQEALAPGTVGPRGNRRPDAAPVAPFRCAGDDDWCVIAVRSDEHWQGLRRAMGDPSWAADDRFATAAGRLGAVAEVEAGVAAWTATLGRDEVERACHDQGVPAGRMLTGSDLLDDPHLQARGWTLELDHPGLGPILLEGPAFLASGLGLPDTFPAPGLGQHTREIAAELLGLDEATIDQLVADGVLEVDTSPDTAGTGPG